MDRRLYERTPVTFQLRVTSITNPEISAFGQAMDISKSGIGVNLPVQFMAGSLVQLDIADSSLCGFIAYSRKWTQPSESSFGRNKLWIGGAESTVTAEFQSESAIFQTGIEIVEAVIGNSGLSQLLRETLEAAMPHLQTTHTDPS